MYEKKPTRNSCYKISIFGDSISTYEGFNPAGYPVYYAGNTAYENGITCAADTWWKKVIDKAGGTLCVNNSYSGSFVAGTGLASACSKERCLALHREDIIPDIVLIYIGTNDRGYGVNIGIDNAERCSNFYGAYRTMLRRIKNNYPSAEIICGTLLAGYLKGRENVTVSDGFRKDVVRYNEAIRTAVKEENCLLADIACFERRYETLDYCHPTKRGHDIMAKLWWEKLNPILNH